MYIFNSSLPKNMFELNFITIKAEYNLCLKIKSTKKVKNMEMIKFLDINNNIFDLLIFIESIYL